MPHPNLNAVLSHLAGDRDNAVERMLQLLSIPSISTNPAHKSDIAEASRWVADTLASCGLDTAIHETDGGNGHPVVLARTVDDSAVDRPDRRVLFYGHYDVQPPDPLDHWQTPPFEPTIRDGAVYARGASDDKGQVCCFLEALSAWKQVHGKLPCHVTVLIEGEEEIGSEHLPPFIEANRDALAADIAVVSDTSMWDKQTVAITYGLRGLLYFDIKLTGPNRDLHSGIYGGSLPNPATILARILGDLFDSDHRVVIDGYYDDVLPLDDEEREEWAKLSFDERDYFDAIGVAEGYGESGFTTLERRWARPACEVCGIYGGYTNPGAKTIIPSFAGAKVNFRLAANQDPLKIAEAFKTWLIAQPRHGLKLEIEEHGHAYPVIVSRNSPFIDAAGRAIERTSRRPPALERNGATIPVVSDFKSRLGIDTLLVGFGQHDDRIHAPNEKFDLSGFHLGCDTHAALLAELAAV